MKKISLVLLTFLLMLVTACEMPQTQTKTKLVAPQISLRENVIKWNPIEHATSYEIYVNDEMIGETTIREIDLSTLDYGTNLIYIIATSTDPLYTNSLKSNIISYVKEQMPLDAPIISINDRVISWDKVANASSYHIYMNDEYKTLVDSLTYEIPENTESGSTFKVIAISNVADYKNSDYSNSVTYYVQEEGPKEYHIFMINDTHGAFTSEENQGVENVAGLLETLEKNNEYIKVANGDMFQGSYVSNVLYGLPILDALNAMDFDAFVIGNHEFDWGLDKIAVYNDGDLSNGEAEFPFLGANIIEKATGKIPSWMEPYTVVNKGGTKVGIIGVIGDTFESSILAENVAAYDFIYPLELIKQYASELRNTHNCDSVIVSMHAQDYDLIYDLTRLTGDSLIDAVLCAHTHQRTLDTYVRSDGATIYSIQNRSNNIMAATLSLSLDANNKLVNTEANHYYINNYSKSASMKDVVDRYASYINESTRVLGSVSYSINKSTLGNYIVTAMKEEYSADVSIMNTGGVRSTIDAGEITVAEVYEVLPFNNEVITTYMTGRQLKSLYNENSSYLYFNSDFNASSLDNNKEYKVAVIDYVYTGAYYDEFDNTIPYYTNVLARDLLLEYIDNLY